MSKINIPKRYLFILGAFIAILVTYGFLTAFINNNESKITNKAEAEKMTAQKMMYSNIGDLIASNHNFYNETLGWGRIKSVKWSVQREQAGLIVSSTKSLSADNKKLKNDIEDIQSLAEKIESGTKDKDILVKLHRYFHDLDIDYNDYKDTSDYYDVTEYKGE